MDNDTMHRIFVEWPNGAYISTLASSFHQHFQELVERYGPPSTVEFRASDEGWVRSGPDPHDGEQGIAGSGS